MLPEVNLGNTEIKIPVFALGTWAIRDKREMIKTIHYAVEKGLNHIDTAEMYIGAEEVVGEAIRVYDREEIFVTSKVLPSNASYKGTIKACERSLKKLKTDYIDLYLLHYYTGQYPLNETFDAFSYLIEKGKIKYAGVSNFDENDFERFRKLLREYDIKNNQIEYNLSNFRYVENKLLPLYEKEKITLSGYSPFWQGNLPERGKWRVLEKIGKRHNKNPFQVILNFLTRHRKIFVIFKTESVEHLKYNLESLDFTLETQDINEISEIF